MASIICPGSVRYGHRPSGVMKKAAFDQAKADACEIIKPSFTLTVMTCRLR